MGKQAVTVFRPYEFTVGQKLHIESGPRKGDWEVVGIDRRKVKLRCPITKKILAWNRFCYVVRERENATWPVEKE